MCCREGLA
ncbi:hypothetical protein F383_31130 [Gossypium arboreum]|uniref:Uncharacterized protein n=1 Tax=Gossypium arboreum TaxID=29729 RepID=A0A0B0PIY5_GOSAR|nr:hypothetical protein F383_31130 [Gossypium arboreum]